MSIVDWHLFQGSGCGNIITFQRIVRPMLLGEPTDEAAIHEAMPLAHVVFAELARLHRDVGCFVGESLADLMVARHFGIRPRGQCGRLASAPDLGFAPFGIERQTRSAAMSERSQWMSISSDCPTEEILLWIHEGHVVTVWSSVLRTVQLDFVSENQNDRSMRDNRVGVGAAAAIAWFGVFWGVLVLPSFGVGVVARFDLTDPRPVSHRPYADGVLRRIVA
ncbi:hypothetical protein [Bradyrhizobium sp. Cp5.3]|uniref:hypothetical protein n=1 Tax=Bradyrhizobium sp. Cp5.3 TaxID=443598 RepID=UPI0004815C1C|nr:hypothetical protein [Bradyrhizobium sp. Cp5.3]